MYIRSNNGANIDPCGTPQLFSLSSELKRLSDKLGSVFKIREKLIIGLTSCLNFCVRIV